MTRPTLAITGRLAVVPLFFGVKIASALILLLLSTAHLSVEGFAAYSQLLLLSALLNMVAVGGAQNGVIRETAAIIDQDGDGAGQIRDAAFALWATISLASSVLLIGFRDQLSTLLVGNAQLASTCSAVVILTLISGPGQIFASILTGSGRVARSLAVQGIGLLAGTAASALLLIKGDAAGAAIAFAAGPVVTTLLAWLALRPINLSAVRRPSPAIVRKLFGYGAALLFVTGFTAAMLFGLRFVYQQEFGLILLGYWIVANRISDTTTQFMGLAIQQLFLPRLAATPLADQRRLILQCCAIGLVGMSSFLAVFAIAPAFFVGLVMSPAYIPAVSGIILYMIGDILRVGASLAMNVQLGRGHPVRAGAIEIATLSLMGLVTLLGVGSGIALAPMIGYVVAYGTTALVSAAVLLITRPHPDAVDVIGGVASPPPR